ncbi:hypothetical protein M2368_000905 [Arthrobacter sp. JUb119]|nr:hypothetical protein [Arthrobacter sp. JUb119]
MEPSDAQDPAEAEKIASMAHDERLDAIARNPASSHNRVDSTLRNAHNLRDSPVLHHWHCPPLHNEPLASPRPLFEVSLSPVKPTPSRTDADCRFVADRTD